MVAPLTENEVRYQNAALADENARMRSAIEQYLSHQLIHQESYTVLRAALGDGERPRGGKLDTQEG